MKRVRTRFRNCEPGRVRYSKVCETTKPQIEKLMTAETFPLITSTGVTSRTAWAQTGDMPACPERGVGGLQCGFLGMSGAVQLAAARSVNTQGKRVLQGSYRQCLSYCMLHNRVRGGRELWSRISVRGKKKEEQMKHALHPGGKAGGRSAGWCRRCGMLAQLQRRERSFSSFLCS